MGKKLKNISKQSKMTEEQEQVFTNGINKGRKLERKRAIKLIKKHELTRSSVAGFLVLCSCGEAVDYYLEHLVEAIESDKE